MSENNTLQAFYDHLIAAGKSKNTARSYLSGVRQFLAETGCDPHKITQETAEDYVAKKSHCKTATIQLALISVRVFTEFLGQKVHIKTARPETRYLNRRFPTPAEMRRLWREIAKQKPFYRYRDKAIISVLYHTGIRIDEARTITTQSIDFHNRRLMVLGKGRKYRSVPLNTPVMLDLIEYMGQREGLPITSDALFVSFGKNHRYEEITYGSFRQIIKSHLKAAGLGELQPYCFRHGFATNLSRKGIDPVTISQILGHDARKFGSLPYYVSPGLANLEEALESLGQEVAI